MSIEGKLPTIRRGSIWSADLVEPIGSPPRFKRPVLVVSADRFNRSSIGTVLGVAITSNLALAMAPGNVRLPKGAGGLPKVSVVNVSQLVTLDREQLIERVGTITQAQLTLIDAGLRLVLEL